MSLLFEPTGTCFLFPRHLLTYVDPVTGHQRSEKRLQERLHATTGPTVVSAFRCMLHYASFFHPDPRAVKKYDKALVQVLAVFQSCS